MNILIEIHEKFREPELHICADRKNEEVLKLKNRLEDLMNEKITAYKGQETKKIPAYEIVRIYSENKKVYLRTMQETYEIHGRLYALEKSLDRKGFVRISNSEIVGISQIEKMDMGYAGTIKMYMKNGDITFVSRRYIGKIKEQLLAEV